MQARRPVASHLGIVMPNFMTTEPIQRRARHIGIVSYDYDPPIGGLGVLVRTYIDEMRKLYPEDMYTVVSPSKNADDFGSSLGRARYRKSGGCPLFSIGLFFTLSKIVHKHSFDLVHVHAGSGGVFLLRKPPCKLVVTAHHTYRQEADLVFAKSPLKKAWKLFMALLEARTYHLADMVVCVSKDTAHEIMEQYGVPAARVRVIENPVRELSHASKGVIKKADTVLFVGRLEKRKGVLLLLEAFSILRTKLPDAKLRLVGSNLLGSHLQSFLRKKKLTDSVTSLGYVHDPYRFRETAEATVLVVPSILEGFGLVAAEAMMIGTCVIASDAPGLRSIVSDGKTGVLFPVGNIETCADAMFRVLQDSSLRNGLVSNALAEAPVRFSVIERSKDLRAMYDLVLAN